MKIEDASLTIPLTSPDVNLIWTFIRWDELMFVPEHHSVGLAEITSTLHLQQLHLLHTRNHQQWR